MSAGSQALDVMTLEPMDDAGPDRHDAILVRALAGDRGAFGELVRLHQRRVYSLGLRMLGDRQDAEDLAQEVFLQLHHRLSAVHSGAHLAFWLRRVTLHRAIDRLRRVRETAPLTEADGVAGETADADPLLSSRLAQLVGQLPPAPRAVLVLRYQEDLDPTQIARTLGMSIHTVKSHLKRSLSLLRERLAPAVQGGAPLPSRKGSPA
jgi:RNA polymerase sigma-70 factor (ECF subfamily)